MTKYLSHTDYNRWGRAYLINLQRFVDGLNAMRLILDDLHERGELEKEIDHLEEKLENAIPRNFNLDGEPLTPGETFMENLKVLTNLVYKALHLEEPFRGIYYNEKVRILHIHQENKFKEKYVILRSKVEELLKVHKEAEELAEKQAEEERAKKTEEELAAKKAEEDKTAADQQV